ncbi:hypothetical protein [Clostridium sp. FP1]|uniref:hypothetical protein n=1 Tax=Clostridium sp. FP1 TaxID=2724076 RepID=UPI0013E96949|nr:hypothetical protein [Clostridium sp. FP1]MBZ9633359.1 hypothetical protein [Clostridium sp. FP1]
MKTFTNNIESVSLGFAIGYFILRIIYEISYIKIINQITVLLSIIAGIAMLIISGIIFFYDKKKKESIQPFLISIILIFISII